MKTKLCVGIALLTALWAGAQTNDLTGLLQQGLFEEQANRDLDAAIADYQSLAQQFDKDRQLAATAVFRLGECYRAQGRTNEAAVQYARIIHDFPDQQTLATLSRQDLTGMGMSAATAGTVNATTAAASASAADAAALARQIDGIEKLKQNPEEQARAVLAIFPDDQLREILEGVAFNRQQGDQMQTNAAAAGGNTNLLAEALKQQFGLIQGRVNFVLDNQRARLKALQMGTATDAAAANGDVQLWNNLKNMPQAQVERMLPTLVPDATLDSLLQQRNEAQAKLAQLQTDYSTSNVVYVREQTLLRELQRQTDEKIAGMLQALKLKADLAGGSAGGKADGPGGSAATGSDEDREIQRIQQVMQDSPDLINAASEGSTPLVKAAFNGWLKVATYLLDHGAQVNTVSPDVRWTQDLAGVGPVTPLTAAVVAGNKAMAEYLISRSADVNFKVKGENTLLHLAAQKGFQAVAEVLLANHANVNARNEHGATPLFLAAKNGQLKLVQTILNAGAEVNSRDERGWTVLNYAIGNSPELFKALSAAGIDPNTEDRFSSRTPLSYAVQQGNPEVIEMLLTAKADPNEGNDPPLLRAVEDSNVASAELLLLAGADPNLKREAGRAVTGRNPRYDADITKMTPIFCAVQSRQPAMVQLLLKYKADPNDTQTDGKPLLFWAFDQTEIMKMLVAAGASIEARSSDGRTALGEAVEEDKLAAVQTLLAAKADPNADQGINRPAIFAGLTDTNLLAVLLNAGANVEAHDKSAGLNGELPNWTPLAAAAWNQAPAAVDLLLKRGANPNVRDANGNTPLHWAVSWLHGQLTDRTRQIVELLLTQRADPNIRNDRGTTPLDWAKQKLGETAAIPRRQLPARRPSPNTGTADNAADSDLAVQQIISLLREHGALDQLPDWNRITVARPSADFSYKMFQKGTNDWNRFMLSEMILNFFESSETYEVRQGGITSGYPLHSMLPFPDLAHLTICRPDHDSTNVTRLVVNLLNGTNGIDRAKDQPLMFGDVVEVPEREHSLGDNSPGLSDGIRTGLIECAKGSAELRAHGQTVKLEFLRSGGQAIIGNVLSQTEARKVLLSSSDLSRVTVKRTDPATGKSRECVLDCDNSPKTTGSRNAAFSINYQWNAVADNPVAKPELWLENGDVIEVPDK